MRALPPRLVLFASLGGCVEEDVVYRIPEPIPGLGWDLDAPAGGEGSTDPGSGEADSGAPLDCEDAGTWATTGHPLMLSWCTGCHSSQREGSDRHGAPADVNLDSLEGFSASAGRSLARMEAGTMPAGGGLSDPELRQLRAWVDCGLEGEEARLTGRVPETGPVDGSIVRTEVRSDGPLVEAITNRSELLGDLTGRRVLTEDYLLDGDDAWLVGWRWEDLSGDRAESYDPPVPLTRATDSWVHTTTVTRTEGGTSETTTETWTLALEAAEDVDARAPDPHPMRLLALTDAGGEQGWHLSDRFGITARWVGTPEGDTLVLVQALDQGDASWEGFPLAPGDDWRSHAVAYGALQ
jgi:hypothetical protein